MLIFHQVQPRIDRKSVAYRKRVYWSEGSVRKSDPAKIYAWFLARDEEKIQNIMVTAEEDTRTFKLGSFTSFGIKNDERSLWCFNKINIKRKWVFKSLGISFIFHILGIVTAKTNYISAVQKNLSNVEENGLNAFKYSREINTGINGPWAGTFKNGYLAPAGGWFFYLKNSSSLRIEILNCLKE